MGSQNSQGDRDGLTWVPVSLPIGEQGLDLRRPGEPASLTVLLNAKFIDSKTVARRDGHTGQLLQSYSAFRQDKAVTDRWVYGHGTVISVNNQPLFENSKHPIHNRGAGVFELDGVTVAWTGDRVLVVAEDGPFYGSSNHWDRTV